MFPSWGNFGGGQGHQPPPQQFGGPRPQQTRGPSPQGGGFGGYGAPAPAAHFSSLREQHLQQMQQLQQLHQKQLQSVLHHNNNVNTYGGSSAAVSPGSSWQDDGSGGYGPGAHTYYQEENQSIRGPSGPQPPPPQPAPPKEAQPPPPEPGTPAPPVTPQNNGGTPAPKEVTVNKKDSMAQKEQANSSAPEEEKPDFSTMSLQDQQQYWYKQHLQNLQRLRNEKAKQNQNQGDSPAPPPKTQPSGPAPPLPSEPPKSTPPPPPPKEEPPPPPPPEETPEVVTPKDPEEAARLQQLQAAAAQWQQVQQQRAGFQYQALMQQHAQLQQILGQYQQFVQQPAHLETMPMDMQLRHYEMQQQQFAPVFQEWDRTFTLWQEQFQSYPHKDQLQDYECQWKQWQEQMNSTNAHLQERVSTLRAMQPYGGSQYGSGMIGQDYGQYPYSGPEGQMQHMASPSMPATPSIEPSPTSEHGSWGPRAGQQGAPNAACMSTPTPTEPYPRPTGPGIQSEPYSSSGPPVRGAGPAGRGVRTPGPTPGPPPRYNGPRGPRFDGPRGNGPRFEQQPQRFNAPPRFDQRQRFDQPPRGNQPRFGQQARFEQPPRQGPPSRFERPPGPQQGVQQGPQQQGPQQQGVQQGPQPRPEHAKDTKPQQTKAETPVGSKPLGKPTGIQQQATQDKMKPEGAKETENMTDDMLDSLDGFFVQKDPIPQTTSTKVEPNKPDAASNNSTNNEKTPDAAKTPVSAPSSVPQKNATPVKSTLQQGGQPNNVNNGPLLGQKPHGPEPPKPGMPKQPPGFQQGETHMAPHMSCGTGRGQPPVPLRGLGRGRGQRGRGGGLHGGPEGPPHGYGLNPQPLGEEVEQMPYDYRPPHEETRQHGEEEDYQWQDPSLEEPSGMESEAPPPEEEMWVPEEHYYPPEEHYEEPGRGGPPMGRGEPFDRHWEEPEPPEYWEEGGDPYWMDRRPPMRGARPPFPPGRGRPPRGRPGFMHQGPRRPLPHAAMDHDPHGLPMPYDNMEMDPMGPPMHPPMHRGPGLRGRPMHHDMMDRDMRRPPLPREMMERDPMEHPPYHDDLKREPGWPRPPHLRGPPPPPHEMIERGMRRRPMGHRPMGRGMRRPPPPHEVLEEGFNDGYSEEFRPDDGYGRPPVNYRPQEYERDEEYYEPRGEWDRERPERDYPPYPPRGPPPERFREDKWEDERQRPYPYEEEERGRGDHRFHNYQEEPPYRREEPHYPPPPDWERPPPRPPPERGYPPDFEDRRPHFDARPEPSLDIPPPPPPAAPLVKVQESPLEAAPQGTNAGILALSQRQHEIILKAAQELKLIREMQEGKTSVGEPQSEPQPELSAGLMGLEIPPEVRSALKATNLMTESGKAPANKLWDAMPPDTGFLSSAIHKSPVIPKTVDYGHGHEPGTTVERMSYGERIVLRPDPVPSDRIYEKEPLGQRDPYSRDPYYDRRGDPYAERREYSREREIYRDKPPVDFERERYERDRYPPRDDSKQSMVVEERLPPGPPPRPGYRDRERDMREREGRSSRDRDEPYGRPGYDRPPYERSGPERYDHGSSPYGDRRGYPEERGPGSASSLPPPPPAPPRVEKKPETKNVEDLLKPPGRSTRPERIVIIMRGLPGSGKSHVAKLMRDKEVECGGAPPRVLGLDDYFMTEIEKVEKDPDTGKRMKLKVLEYEYEPEMEDTYRSSMLKTFRKTLDDGFFPFIIIDAINDRVKYFDQFWSAAKTKGFEVYVAEITGDSQTCAKRNVHGRKLKDITKMSSNWESSPRHMVRLDVRSLLQDAAIEEVEMEDFNPEDEPKEPKKEEEEEGDLGYIPKSKWEMDTSEAKLDKLDGLVSGGKRKRDGEDMEDFLQLPDDYATRMSEPGKKRVRWADLEEQKDADRKRAIGFVVGQTDWEKITDESGQLAQRALNRTKYF